MEAEFEDTFAAPVLDRGRWIPYYLPQWSSRSAAAARYRVGGGRLRLYVAADQPPWCPELDGDVRVSSLQTGVYAGPVGSTIGQHRFHPAAVVRQAQPEQRLYTPRYGRVETRARAVADPRYMVALWMIGFEDVPEHSAEICVCEVFGREADASGMTVGVGVHPFGDRYVRDDFAKVRLPLRIEDFHTYAADWTPGGVVFSVDGEPVHAVESAPDYAMQLMLSIYEFRDGPVPDPVPEFQVSYVRGYRR